MTDAIPDKEFIATPEEALAAKLKLAEMEVATLAAALVYIETMIEDSFSLWDGTMDMTTATMLLRRTQEIALEPWKSLESARPARDRMMRQNGELREHLWQLEGAVRIIDDNAEPLMTEDGEVYAVTEDCFARFKNAYAEFRVSFANLG